MNADLAKIDYNNIKPKYYSFEKNIWENEFNTIKTEKLITLENKLVNHYEKKIFQPKLDVLNKEITNLYNLNNLEDLLSSIRNPSLNQFTTNLKEFIEESKNDSEQEDISISSLKNFIIFSNYFANSKFTEVIVLDNGTIRARWFKDKNNILIINFESNNKINCSILSNSIQGDQVKIILQNEPLMDFLVDIIKFELAAGFLL